MNTPKIIDIANAPTLSDEAQFEQFLQDRDREVMAALYRKHMTLVFGVCMKYLGEKTAAQDATMDVFEQLLDLQPANPIKNFRAYLYVLTKNFCLMKKRGEKVQLVEISDSDMELATEVHPIDEQREKRASALEACIKQLKDLQHKCIVQFYLKQKSYMEISDSLSINLMSVKSHIQNGKRNLKICIDNKAA